MIYKLRCPQCNSAEDYNLAMNDVDAEVACEKCGAQVFRKYHRIWEATFQIQGDTVPRGCSYDYWDENLGVRVKSKAHRADEMNRRHQKMKFYSSHNFLEIHNLDSDHFEMNRQYRSRRIHVCQHDSPFPPRCRPD